MSWYNLGISPGWVVAPGFIQGLGMGAMFVPLSTMAYGSMPREQTDNAAGLFNLARTLGSAMGVSIAVTWYTRFGQAAWNQLGGHISPFNPALYHWLSAQGLTLSDPLAPVLLARTLGRQASMLAFTQVFELIAVSFLAIAPLLLLMRPERPAAGAPSP